MLLGQLMQNTKVLQGIMVLLLKANTQTKKRNTTTMISGMYLRCHGWNWTFFVCKITLYKDYNKHDEKLNHWIKQFENFYWLSHHGS